MCYSVMSLVLCLSYPWLPFLRGMPSNDLDISFIDYFVFIYFSIHDQDEYYFKRELAFNFVIYARYPSMHFTERVFFFC